MSGLYHIWVYMAASPLLHLTLTLAAYQAGAALYAKSGYKAWANPILFAVLCLVLLLKLTGTDYKTYFAGAKFVHFLLGPATVALAVPLYRAYEHIRTSAAAIIVSIVLGALIAVGSSVGIAAVLGATHQTLMSLAPKSVTTPIAMGISEETGGIPSLTAVLVVMTGIIGAVMSTFVLNLARVTDVRARGLATGLAAHGMGTAHKLRINETAGAFAGLAMGLNGLVTSVLVPLLVRFFH